MGALYSPRRCTLRLMPCLLDETMSRGIVHVDYANEATEWGSVESFKSSGLTYSQMEKHSVCVFVLFSSHSRYQVLL